MAGAYDRQPNYAVPVGDFVVEWMEANGINAAELSRRLGVSSKYVSELLRASVSLTPEMALKLDRVTGVSADWWLRLETQYRQDQVRLMR